eukprot:GFKZ01012955.1.p1 GENE.GFKZ01012955.1~~GFKZ01012955.1.p1  ORF type:complete len:551 (-),score=104.30 GFKZ01012955.1:152-1804(-)
MGSDLGTRHPEVTAARARRSLAAARAARDGITTMVDSLKISKPPRAPPSVSQSRRHALIPHAEGRAQLEARIRTLEDMISARDTAQTKLKAQWGRALVKRRAAERERDAMRVNIRASVVLRKQFERFIQDISVPLPDLRQCTEKAEKEAPALAEEVAAALDDIDETIATAKDALAAPSPVVPGEESLKRIVRGVVSTGGSDDDARSVASFASSALGDDRETQLDALVELVEMLEVRLAGKTHPVVSRAKKTMAAARSKVSPEIAELILERDRLKEQLQAVMEEKESVGGEDAALALAARAEAELRDANKEIAELKERLVTAERLAGKVVRQEELLARNSALESELRSAKKTVGRLVQERNVLRKTAPSAALVSNASSASRTPRGGNSEAMRRILDWRRMASSENQDDAVKPIPMAEPFEPKQIKENKEKAEELYRAPAPLERAEPLPDRQTTTNLQRSPVKKRRVAVADVESVNAVDANSYSERSVEVGLNDSVSVQSLPVQGFLRRHDSFLSAGSVSASGDAITLNNSRHIFSAGGPKVDGLRGLLNGS